MQQNFWEKLKLNAKVKGLGNNMEKELSLKLEYNQVAGDYDITYREVNVDKHELILSIAKMLFGVYHNYSQRLDKDSYVAALTTFNSAVSDTVSNLIITNGLVEVSQETSAIGKSVGKELAEEIFKKYDFSEAAYNDEF